jgi:tRNA nucleotidyltransferase (CCA-adding enzyme)
VVTRSSLEESVLEELRPGHTEQELVRRVAGRLVNKVNESNEATGMVVGSIARDTWTREDRDLDIFMLFSPELPREDLEERGLRLARSIAESEGGAW